MTLLDDTSSEKNDRTLLIAMDFFSLSKMLKTHYPHYFHGSDTKCYGNYRAENYAVKC